MGQRTFYWALVVALVCFTSCCASTYDPPRVEPLDNQAFYIRTAVRIRVGQKDLKNGQEGSGVIVRSDELGTFFITNAHVALIVETDPATGNRIGKIPERIVVDLWDGRSIEADLVAVTVGSSKDDVGDIVVDGALLWAPHIDNLESCDEDLDPWNLTPGSSTFAFCFSPRNAPYEHRSRFSPEMGDSRFRLESVYSEFAFGNSGSGVFDSSGKLIGLVWGMKTDDRRIGMITPLYMIQGALREQGWGWVLK